MLVDKSTEVEVIGSLKGEEVKMSLDASGMGHIMSMLTRLYSDEEMAVLREYSTNALDAHIEAGNDAPIEISLPSGLSNFLKIKDYGPGLDAEDIREMYSKYGASSKRGSNEQHGMFGLGSKSALAYTSQFILEGIKDGIKTIVSVTRDEDEGGSMTIVSEKPSDEPSGVCVTIPARNGLNNFHEKANRLFQFWEEGTVLVNGRAMTPFQSRMAITDCIDVIQGSTSYVIMGNVPYPVDFKKEGYELNLPYSTSIVARVPIGEVIPAPSRELLRMTTKTKATLDAIVEAFETNRLKSIEARIAAAPSLYEAIKLLKTLKDTFGDFKLPNGLTYKGKVIPATITLPDGSISVGMSHYYGKKLNEHSRVQQISMSEFPDVLFVTDWDQVKFTPTTKKKLLKHQEDSTSLPYGRSVIMLREGMPAEAKGIIAKANVIPYQTIKDIKIEYQKVDAQGKVSIGEYKMYVHDGTDGKWIDQAAEEINIENPIFYGEYSKGRTYNEQVLILKGDHEDGFTFVEMYQNRIAKFKRLFGDVVEIGAECRRLANEWVKKVNQDDVLALKAQAHYQVSRIKPMAPYVEQIKDPELVYLIELATKDLTDFRKRANLYEKYIALKGRDFQTDAFEQYPLIDGYNRDHRHWVIYVNAVYTANTLVDPIASW